MRYLLFSLLLAVSGHALATTYHVTTSGDDANDGLSSGTAWASPQRGADAAVAGDTVLVHAGNFPGFAAMDHSGTPNAPIVLMGIGGVVNITTPCAYNNQDGINVEGVDWIVIEGFTVENMPRTGIRTALTDHVTIRYNKCIGNYKWGILTGFAEHVIVEHNTCNGSQDEHGIYFSNSADDPIIRFNEVMGNNANGIHMNGDISMGGDGVISNAQVYGNIIHGNGTNGGSGINCDGVVNSVFFNNLLYDNHASGISLYQIDGGAPSTGNKVYNNIIMNASDARWCVNITEGCTGNQLLNNILINEHIWRGSIVIADDAHTGFVSDYNLVVERLSPDGDATVLNLAAWQALGYDVHSQAVDPFTSLFVDAHGGDFHGLSSQSQQVDAGTAAVLPVVTEDLDLVPRPQGAAFDVGCYERGMSTSVKPQAEPAGTAVTCADGILWLVGAPAGAVLEMFDATGRMVGTFHVRSEHDERIVVNVPSMVYYRLIARSGQLLLRGVVAVRP